MVRNLDSFVGHNQIHCDPEDKSRIREHSWKLSGKNRDIINSTSAGGSIGRFILRYSGPLQVDHKDRNIYNNRKQNLRLATPSQQAANQKPRAGLKGVSFEAGKFVARIKCNGKVYYLGRFVKDVEAARAYDVKAKQIFGEFASLNFPEKEDNHVNA